MNEPMVNQKTTVVASVYVLLQALGLVDVLDPAIINAGENIVTGLLVITLGLKARRAMNAPKA